MMRGWLICACVGLLTSVALPQQPSTPANSSTTNLNQAKSNASAASGDNESALKTIFEAKIKAEWEAIKNKDKKTYGELLADDYEGVEADGRGERTKIQAINELVDTNVFTYTLWGFKVTSLGPDAAFVIYEVTMQFPPRAQIRFSRVYIGEVWAKRDGQWKLLHYQETHVK
jgi:hypothetical protein